MGIFEHVTLEGIAAAVSAFLAFITTLLALMQSFSARGQVYEAIKASRLAFEDAVRTLIREQKGAMESLVASVNHRHGSIFDDSRLRQLSAEIETLKLEIEELKKDKA